MISQEKIKEWVEIFLKHIEQITPEIHVSEQEGYKFRSVETFQKNFNIGAPDLVGMLDLSIESNNLVIGSFYFAKKMLLIFAHEYQVETRAALNILFDETISVSVRLTSVKKAFDELMEKRNLKLNENANSFLNLRFLSLLLGYRFPATYNAIKPSNWKVFCKFINTDFKMPQGSAVGQQYEIFTSHIEALRQYIIKLPQVISLHDQLTRGLDFTDLEYRWMAQDVIYVTSRIFAAEKSGEPLIEQKNKTVVNVDNVQESGEDYFETTEMEFPLEKYLEHFIVSNWRSINFGQTLELFIDEDGTSGQQYITDVGIIDILAKDKDGNFVVLELKRSGSNPQVIGQILSYIQWVKENLATKKQTVRGIVICSEGNRALLVAQRAVSELVSIKYYRVKLDIIDPLEEN
jgi:hypothetical protein